MEQRQEQLLNLVIENHIAMAEPVGSKFLVSEEDLDFSEATVRNELRVLEEEGYLTHPHTSAGRIPTAKGYRYYVDHAHFSGQKISEKEKISLDSILKHNSDHQLALKEVAKKVVELTQEAVLIAFSVNQIYYTGLSYLFQKPEFSELGLIVNVSGIFDHFEDVLANFYEKVKEEPTYFIGEEHNLGSMLSVLAARFGKNNESLIALLGPQRMNYKRNFALIEKVLELV